MEPPALGVDRVVRPGDRHNVQEHRDEVASVRDDVLGPAHALVGVESGVRGVGHLGQHDERVAAELSDHLAGG